ncbi:TerB family tellurite resistance protein [Thalassovita aquimarina]|uniref:TerB family tellurite resistance protein n=1 Tax=Thalassovita aquimarina TaxID=2785917 RepID=A0ABS5HRM7_9RHOB|nr:TerB family tellurite resistance protein [Thalassovita aquimarina]MBR9651636.1 TerB family tellurite resistance protein [Thalassovita aquimarina]
MFANLLSALTGHRTEEKLPDPDAATALGALLVRVAKSNLSYQVEEIRRIDRLLARIHNLSPVEAAKMRATCEKLERRAPPTEIFAEMIREGVDFDDRLQALEAMWQVVLADGKQSPEQTDIVARAQHALGLSEADNLTARTRAQEAR